MKEAPYQTIKEVVRLTGLSEYFIRNGVKAGTVPHITVKGPKSKGPGKYMVNVPLFLEQLETDSKDGSVPFLERYTGQTGNTYTDTAGVPMT